MAILSSLLGEDFSIQLDYTYTTRLLMNDEPDNSRIQISFTDNNIFPFNMYIRAADYNTGKAIFGSPITKVVVYHKNITERLLVKKFSKILLIFEYPLNLHSDEDNTIGEIRINYEIKKLPVGNEIITDTYMFETKSGAPYRPHEMAQYSEHDFYYKVPLKARSDYMGKTMVSRIVVSHSYENERGYIDRVYTLPKRGKVHGNRSIKHRTISGKEENYIYLDPLEHTKNIIKNSNNVIRGIMFQTSDYPLDYGTIVFKFFTMKDGKKVYLLEDDIRHGVVTAICYAPITLPEPIILGDIMYGLMSENTTNPLRLTLEKGENYKEAEFEYRQVFGNFIFYFKGENPDKDAVTIPWVDAAPPESQMYQLYGYKEALTTIVNTDPTGKTFVWTIVGSNIQTLYPHFSYARQNFGDSPDDVVTHTFYYKILVNLFRVVAVTSLTNPDSEIKLLDLVHASFISYDNPPDKIKFPIKFPTKIFKYNDTIDFPIEKLAEPPNDKTVNIPILYKILEAKFNYIFCDKDNRNIEFSITQRDIIDSTHTFFRSQIPQEYNHNGINYDYWGYESVHQGNLLKLGLNNLPDSLYDEVENEGDEFTYIFLYELRGIKIRIKIVNISNNNLLDLSVLRYQDPGIGGSAMSAPFVDNHTRFTPVISGTNNDNPWQTNSYATPISYKPMDKLIVLENANYELEEVYEKPIGGTHQQISIPVSYTLTPTTTPIIEELLLKYRYKIVNPKMRVKFSGSPGLEPFPGGGCGAAPDHRGAIVDSNGKIVATMIVTDTSGDANYTISSGLIGVELQGTNAISFEVDIQDPNRASNEYNIYFWRATVTGHGDHWGFSFEYDQAGGTLLRAYKIDSHPIVLGYQPVLDATFTPTIEPFLKIDTSQNTTSTVFNILKPWDFGPP